MSITHGEDLAQIAKGSKNDGGNVPELHLSQSEIAAVRMSYLELLAKVKTNELTGEEENGMDRLTKGAYKVDKALTKALFGVEAVKKFEIDERTGLRKKGVAGDGSELLVATLDTLKSKIDMNRKTPSDGAPAAKTHAAKANPNMFLLMPDKQTPMNDKQRMQPFPEAVVTAGSFREPSSGSDGVALLQASSKKAPKRVSLSRSPSQRAAASKAVFLEEQAVADSDDGEDLDAIIDQDFVVAKTVSYEVEPENADDAPCHFPGYGIVSM
jgi:hypothetical protein